MIYLEVQDIYIDKIRKKKKILYELFIYYLLEDFFNKILFVKYF